ncbi:MAG TPA: hypothetical protein VLT88_13760, partial [Desulfosarcina sp.]|nr:hypothetical protein [Desulfosarcina sp.]
MIARQVGLSYPTILKALDVIRLATIQEHTNGCAHDSIHRQRTLHQTLCRTAPVLLHGPYAGTQKSREQAYGPCRRTQNRAEKWQQRL